ncbi:MULTISPECIES: anhydro-N-acetylmuramic acid kinase [Maricaulis]|uniref:Anhydro-N-acetylmuramic acid kinase n=1 Tax=Maricaulis maris TaxID=74318 RepID=A0A495DKB0_9PROT|nr:MULTISPECIES: anhydro-N-acetylmuramic acid kinase [Maricaulis]RKR03049.1 anhydro-N-acetylmuramic acid kinase [Maricaulis maris]
MKRIIGLMSGTSLDGIDAALIETDGDRIARFGPGETQAYSDNDRAILQDAVDRALAWGFVGPRPDFGAAERVLTLRHSLAVQRVLDAAGLAAADIDLLGFHGQTVLHKAPAAGANGQTLQIGDGPALARATGISVIHDFRSADMVKGGQGAPLATLYHDALARQSGLTRPLAVLNLGGVANVTWLAPDADPVAFDTGPANGLIDAWCHRMVGQAYDHGGKLAARGLIDQAALDVLMTHPFFALKPPKSLDRWDFTLDPVLDLAAEDGAATLTAFTARTVADAIAALGRPERVLVTGGGRHNPVLMAALGEATGLVQEPVEAVGWRGDLLEAEAFAWLAARVDSGLPTSLPSTTGASEPVCGGRRADP